MTVVVTCDRCQRQEPLDLNALPPGWLAWPLGWPEQLGGPTQHLCPGCVTLGEQSVLAELVEKEPR